MPVIASLTARFLRQEGQAMAITMLVMMVTMGIAYGAFAATGGDTGLSKRDTDSKRAYSAAEAGLADYLQKLETDNEYWLKCLNVPKPDPTQNKPAPVNQLWSGVGDDPRVWRPVAGDAAAQYTIELVPAAPATQCDENVDSSMLTKDGTLRIKTTGKVGVTGAEVKRSIVTTLRRRGFLDFIYFTDFETGDPTQLLTGVAAGTKFKRCLNVAQAPANASGAQPNCPDEPDLSAWAAQDSTCRQHRGLSGTGRDAVRYTGYQYFDPSDKPLGWWTKAETADMLRCSSIQFADGDGIRGPFHSNDTILVCGHPDFGRNRAGATSQPVDRIEHWGVIQAGACGASSPDYGNNTAVVGESAGTLDLPESNTKLKATAQANGYVFTGKTTIELTSTGMKVNGGAVRAYPTNGLVYVQNAASPACELTDPVAPYANEAQCGDVYLKGDYSANLTIAADRDIVISGDVKRQSGSSYLLGLIANNFVRVEHHMVNDTVACDGQANASTQTQNRTIEAAILSLGHVFTVDNYQCGANLGNLNVVGAIGQKYRGPVGRGTSGYTKAYAYDDRLRYRSPPYFIAPVQSAWRVLRSTEQSPAR